ncbi:hypothetical protein Dda_0073 [Drechslerella dactyloides]|uniref:Uncharacterized protein n=1 Tax=Drechslerella dactyloides TaxID=74499 RepID=A0AAD6NLL3_DREDA|nr:hypothetical protein Dda_0073 [Drechslerella dactyloides]
MATLSPALVLLANLQRPELQIPVEHYDTISPLRPSLVAKCELSLIAITFIFVVLRITLRWHRSIVNIEDGILAFAWLTFAIGMSLETGAYLYQKDWIMHNSYYDTSNETFVTPDERGQIHMLNLSYKV